MSALPIPIAVAVVVSLTSFLDRAWGGGLPLRIAGHGLGKPAALLIFPVMFGLGLSWPLALGMTLSFIAWRSPAWKLTGGSMAPHRDAYLGTFLRHCLVGGYLIAFLVYFQTFDPRTLLIMLFPIPAALLAIQYRKWENERGLISIDTRPDDQNGAVELLRGAILGALVSAVLVWTGVLS